MSMASIRRAAAYQDAADTVAELGEKYYPVDLFGPALTAEEWAQVRTAGIPTERIASDCYRRAFANAARALRDLADEEEE